MTTAWIGIAAMGCSATANPNGEPAPQPDSPASGFYSTTQADRGRATFGAICSECHDTSDFRGDDFEWEWRRRTVWDFYRRLRETMPEDNPGSLRPGTYADVIAYILQLNDYPSGGAELVPEEGPMDLIALGPGVDKSGRSAPTGNVSR